MNLYHLSLQNDVQIKKLKNPQSNILHCPSPYIINIEVVI